MADATSHPVDQVDTPSLTEEFPPQKAEEANIDYIFRLSEQFKIPFNKLQGLVSLFMGGNSKISFAYPNLNMHHLYGMDDRLFEVINSKGSVGPMAKAIKNVAEQLHKQGHDINLVNQMNYLTPRMDEALVNRSYSDLGVVGISSPMEGLRIAILARRIASILLKAEGGRGTILDFDTSEYVGYKTVEGIEESGSYFGVEGFIKLFLIPGATENMAFLTGNSPDTLERLIRYLKIAEDFQFFKGKDFNILDFPIYDKETGRLYTGNGFPRIWPETLEEYLYEFYINGCVKRKSPVESKNSSIVTEVKVEA